MKIIGGLLLPMFTVVLFASSCTTTTGGIGEVGSAHIPNIARTPKNVAHEQLEHAGPWAYVITEKASDKVPPGLVIGTRPPAGTAWPFNRTVDIVVSSGPIQRP